MTDWPKVIEVFGSGIIGVFLVMLLLQILTQFSTRIIDFIENLNKVEDEDSGSEPNKQAVPVKD